MKKTLEQLYTREEFRTVEELKKTMDFKYCPVVFSAFEMLNYGDYTNIRALYLSKVWEEAYKIISNNGVNWPFEQHSWIYNPDSYFKKLIFTCYDFEGEVKRFWETLKDVADSGKIKVQEKIEQTKNGYTYCTGFEKKDCISHLDASKLYSWKWEEIKDFFFELSVDLIALLNGENLNQCSAKDLPLFEACEKGSITEIKKAIKNDANVNAINPKGCTPVQLVTAPGYFVDRDRTEKIKKLLDLLLENGADINLYGFNSEMFCHDIVGNAVILGSDLLEYVLAHGANPVQNNTICDLMNYDTNWKYASYALDYLNNNHEGFDWDYNDRENLLEKISETKSEKKKAKLQKQIADTDAFYSELKKDHKKCEEMLKKAGCDSYYVKGWSREKVDAYEAEYIARFNKMSKIYVSLKFSKTAVLLCGLPSSGKTTFYEYELEQDYPRVEIPVGKNDSEMIDEYIFQNKSFVIDGRFIIKADREPVLNKLKKAGYYILCYFTDYTRGEISEMNDSRAYEERTSMMKIKMLEKTLEKPERSEGIDSLYFVHAANIGEKHKTKWTYKKIGE